MHYLFSNWSKKKFAKTDTKLYVPVVTLLTQDNAILLQQLKSGFKRTINWSKYQSKVSIERQNHYLDYLIDPSCQIVGKIFVLLFENNDDRKKQTGYFLPKVDIRDYNVMADGQNVFDHPVKSDIRTYDNIRKIVTDQGK